MRRKEVRAMANVYEIVTEKIIEKLNQGVIPWRRPWNAPAARNWQSGKEYNGKNQHVFQRFMHILVSNTPILCSRRPAGKNEWNLTA